MNSERFPIGARLAVRGPIKEEGCWDVQGTIIKTRGFLVVVSDIISGREVPIDPRNGWREISVEERPATEYETWCLENNVSHAHCPLGCDHPQPFLDSEGNLVCGCCHFEHKVTTLMDLCTPENCNE